MFLKKNPFLVISLFLTLNIANAAPPEELTKKASSATRITRFRKQALKFSERARKFGRRLAGTKEYTSEETEWARAKIFTVVVAGALITVGLYLKPFKSSLHSRGPKGGAAPPPPAPSPKSKRAKKKKKKDPRASAGEGAPGDGDKGGKKEEGHGDGAPRDESEGEGAGSPKPQSAWWQSEHWSKEKAPTTRAALEGTYNLLSFVGKKFEGLFGQPI